MAQGVRSNRYSNNGASGVRGPSGPSGGKYAAALGDPFGTHTKALKSGKGGSTKKRRPSVGR